MNTILLMIAVWWIANTITSITSKNVVIGRQPPCEGITPAFWEMRWVELTAIQFWTTGIASWAWFTVVKRKQVHLKRNKKEQISAIAVNLVGLLSVNASFTFVGSSTIQMIKSCEPILLLLLLFVFDDKNKTTRLNSSVIFSVVIMSLGLCFFVRWDFTFNVWEIIPAIISSIAYPLRNIMLKNLSKIFDDPLKPCAVLSIFGSILMVPVLCLRGLINEDVIIFRSKWSSVSAFSYSICNIASIIVLQSLSPLHHAILNFTRRAIVLVANMGSIKTIITWLTLFGLGMVVTGLTLFYLREENSVNITFYRKIIPSIIGLVSFASVVSAGFMVVNVYMETIRSFPDCYQTPTKQNKIATSWIYERPIPPSIVENMKTVHNQTFGLPIHVYCGTSQCVTSIRSLNNPSIAADFLVIPDLVRNTPIEAWFMRHTLNKILAGVHFEDHLQLAVRLSHLWHYGGIFIDPTVEIKNKLRFPCKDKQWLTISRNSSANTPPSILEILKFPPRHPFVRQLSNFFGSEYHKRARENPRATFKEKVWDIYSSFCNTSKKCLTLVPLHATTIAVDDNSSSGHRFGTLSYDSRVQKGETANLDDEIQGFPGVQFLPYVDVFLDTEKLRVANREDNFTIFFNAWWGDGRTTWPPPQNLHPIMLSVQLDPAIRPIIAKDVTFLRHHAPIGCKDVSSLNFLKNLGVNSFLSGWLTLLLKSPNAEEMRSSEIYLVDVNDDIREILPPEIRQQAIPLTHRILTGNRFQSKARFIAAYELVEKYSRAKLVITQRIYCAVPCIAMGIPVLFINSSSRPSYGADKLTKLFHTLDIYNTSIARRWLRNFNWSNPPSNSNVGMLMSMRATFWNVIRKNRVFYESAQKFGLIPLSLPAKAGRREQLFHLVFTTTKNSKIRTGARLILSGEFRLRHWRSLESIFYHHPFAKVMIHSNTLDQSTYDVLTEAGYDVEVMKYNLTTLTENTPAEIFVKQKMKAVTDGVHWYAHESDLLRILFLYKFGGVYLDTDVIVVRSMDTLEWNVLGYEQKDIVNNAVMKFEKGHPYLGACLDTFAKHYQKDSWGGNGPELLTLVWKSWPGGKDKSGVKIVPKDLFYLFRFDKALKECFEDTSGAKFEAQMKIVKTVAYAVHLYSKLTGRIGTEGDKAKDGTICKHLLNDFCILCDKTF